MGYVSSIGVVMRHQDDLIRWEQNLRDDFVDVHQRIGIGVKFFGLIGPYAQFTDGEVERWFTFHKKWEAMDQSEQDAYRALLALEGL